MFLSNGWETCSRPEHADLICFTGGADVSPMVYGGFIHPRTEANPIRDAECYNLAQFAWENQIPMVGICRGAQFLNVMCGGDMFQHVEGHTLGKTHPAWCLEDKEYVNVTSTHHQMMIPGEQGELLLRAKLSSRREYETEEVDDKFTDLPDIEAVYYPKDFVLCYQPHPEFVEKEHECQRKFFRYLQKLFKVST